MRPSQRTGLVLTLFTIAVGKFCTGCGYTITDARRDLTTGAQVQMEGIATYKRYDLDHQRAIVSAADLAAYRSTQPKVIAAFNALAEATRAASGVLDAIEDGRTKGVSIAAAMAPVFSTAAALYYALKATGLDWKPLKTLAGVVQ